MRKVPNNYRQNWLSSGKHCKNEAHLHNTGITSVLLCTLSVLRSRIYMLHPRVNWKNVHMLSRLYLISNEVLIDPCRDILYVTSVVQPLSLWMFLVNVRASNLLRKETGKNQYLNQTYLSRTIYARLQHLCFDSILPLPHLTFWLKSWSISINQRQPKNVFFFNI